MVRNGCAVQRKEEPTPPHADIVVLTNIVNVSVTFPRTNSISRREEEVVWVPGPEDTAQLAVRLGDGREQNSPVCGSSNL